MRFQSDTILETKGLSKSFTGFNAVSNVDLKVQRGSIHALIGPNGAGKTTCFNLLTKFLEPSAGTILFNGIDVTNDSPEQVAKRGVIRSFQICSVFPNLSALENVRIGLQRRQGTAYCFWRSESTLRRLDERAMELLERVDLAHHAGVLASDLSYGRKRALELATTLGMEPEFMLLDEPTQGMGHEDVGRVTELIKRASVGRTVLMVEHNMKVVASIADRITVLQRGEILADGTYDQVSIDPQVMEAYMGEVVQGEEVA
jgi:branched-chain amino acid transport system ATP-binding protein